MAAPSPVGARFSNQVLCMTVFDDAAGLRSTPGPIQRHSRFMLVPSIARWNGTTWSSVGGERTGRLRSRSSIPNRSKLVAGGGFTTAGGAPASNFAVWDKSWSCRAVDGRLRVRTRGVRLGRARNWSRADRSCRPRRSRGERIAKWNGSSWSALL
jgi:hypothetical protein